MARTVIPITTIVPAGTAPPTQTAGNASEGNELGPNDGLLWLEIVNASTSTTLTATIVTQATEEGIAIEDEAIAVPKESTRLAGPFTPVIFNGKQSAIQVNVTSAELKFRAYRL